MAILRPVLTGTQSYPDPLTPATEITAFSGNSRKIYLAPGGCGYNYVLNGGGATTTDWINDTNGIADKWAIEETSLYGSTASVNNGGNGFTNKHQYLAVTLSSYSYTALKSDANFTPVQMGTRTYRISMIYRSNAGVGVWVRKSNSAWGSDQFWGNLATNNGNAIYASLDVTVVNSAGSYITGVFLGHNQTVGEFSWWFDVDEVHCCDLAFSG